MINILRGLLKKVFTNPSTKSRIFNMDGRYEETIQGRLYQHFGFKSFPPNGVNLLCIKDGNNVVSTAEDDGNLFTFNRLESGDTVLYCGANNCFIALKVKDFNNNPSLELITYVNPSNPNDFVGVSINTSGDGMVEIMSGNAGVTINNGNLTVDK